MSADQDSVSLQKSNHANLLLCLRGSMSRQHQCELMQSAWLQLADVFNLVEATHECAVCRHLSGPLWWQFLSQLSAAAPIILPSRPSFQGNILQS